MSEQFELFTPEAVAPEQKTKKTGAKYPALKIVSMILGILAGIAFIVYAARYTKQYLEQIAQYKGMGMDIPQSTLNVIYIQLALTFVAGLLPILGAVFSNKLAKLSAVLTAAPICWGLTNAIPTIIISIVQKAEFKDLIDVILLGAGGLLALISAIFIIATPAYSEDGEDGSFEEFRIDGADNVAFDISDEVEAAEEKAEDALDFAKDAVDDVAEGAADAVEEAKEAVSDIAEDVAEEVKDAASDITGKDE